MNSEILMPLVVVFILAYALNAAPTGGSFMKNNFFKVLVFFLIAFAVSKDFMVSIVVALVVYLFFQYFGEYEHLQKKALVTYDYQQGPHGSYMGNRGHFDYTVDLPKSIAQIAPQHYYKDINNSLRSDASYVFQPAGCDQLPCGVSDVVASQESGFPLHVPSVVSTSLPVDDQPPPVFCTADGSCAVLSN